MRILLPPVWCWIVPIAAAAIFCFLPLLDILGYESAAAMGLVLGLCSMFGSASQLRNNRLENPLQMGRRESPIKDFIALFWGNMMLWLGPFALLLLNALRVENCDLLVGVQFWIVIPWVSILLGQALTWLGYAVFPRYGLWSAISIVVLELAWFLYSLANEPPIAGMSWLFGWFAGSIYDEALSLPSILLWYRVWVVGLALTIVGGLEWYWRRQHNWDRSMYLGAFIGGLLLSIGMPFDAAQLWGMHNHASVRKALGGRAESEHFIYYYRPTQIDQQALPRLKEDAEFRYAELQEFFQEDPVAWRKRKIEIYLYPNAEVQQQLMGSRNTFVARPWTHQTHLRWDEYGDHVLAHELAHLFTAPFGAGPLQMAAKWGVLVDTGIVEGIAVAADWPPKELDPHAASAAMQKLGIAPDIRQILSATGFWAQPSRKAYTMMGSFVRWLVDEYGIDKFKVLYQTVDFQHSYGQSVDQLATAWEAFIAKHPVDERLLAVAQYRYDRKSIFEKVCARKIAELQRLASAAERQGRLTEAEALLLQLIELQPQHPTRRRRLAELYVRQQQIPAAHQLIEETLGLSLNPSQQAQVLELRGDILWRKGQRQAAVEDYRKCSSLGTSDATLRSLYSKMAGTQLPATTEQWAQSYLLDRQYTAIRLRLLQKWAVQESDDPLPRYLMGLQYFYLDQYADAIVFLQDARLSMSSLEEQRILLLAEAALHQDQLKLAQQNYQQLRTAKSRRIQLAAEEGELRVRWKASRRE